MDNWSEELALAGHFFTLRLIGKGLLAVGFLLSLYGLGSSNPIILKLSLALLAVGMILQAWGLYSHLRNP
jgi:hypothetical protein